MRTVLLLVTCIALMFGGILMIRQGDVRGWFVATFFGLGIAIFLLQLHPRCSFLTVDEDGIECCTLFRTSRMPWADIAEFGIFVQRHRGLTINRGVGINFSAADPGRARALSRASTGFEGALPDTYGLSAAELAALLSACQSRIALSDSSTVRPTGRAAAGKDDAWS
ncbi:MAG: PH domain-containing protein [Planctomycetales bacterium]